MKNKILGLVVAAALVPFAAAAASFTNVQFDNGDVTISGAGASTVNATFRVTVPANQVVEWVETDVAGDNLAPVCTQVGGDKGLEEGTHDVSLSVKLPPNTGTYTLNVKGAGIFGGFRSVDCNDSVVGSASFGGALRTVSGGTTSGGSTTSDLQAMIASLTAQVSCMVSGGTWNGTACVPKTVPPVATKCAALATKLVGTIMGARNSANVVLQGYLLSEGMDIPALAAGASFGFYGPQTNAALSLFKSANSCN